jgi:ubiquitin C-terminal hydrolase
MGAAAAAAQARARARARMDACYHSEHRARKLSILGRRWRLPGPLPHCVASLSSHATYLWLMDTAPIKLNSACSTTPHHATAHSTMSATGICALYNMGNTCFINSAIQVLRVIPEWAVYCKKHLATKTGIPPLLASYVSLANSMNDINTESRCKPSAFLATLSVMVNGTCYEEFSHNVPHDSHEFMMFLLDKFGEALKCEQPATPNPTIPPAWFEATKKDYNPLVNLTNGLDKITCECMTCGTKSSRWETFSYLKVPIADHSPDISFEERLLAEREPIQVDDYMCDGPCKSRQRVKISREIWKMPRVLFLTVDRFADPTNKNTGAVKITGGATFSGLISSETTDESREWVYDPISIIDHHGSMRGGHYTAQVKHHVSDDAETNASWYLYDDEFVRKIGSEPLSGSSTYIICMRRRIS